MVVHTLIPVATLIDHRGWMVAVYTFNPSTREGHKKEETGAQGLSLYSVYSHVRTGSPVPSEVEVKDLHGQLFCFSNLQLQHQ